MDLSSRTQCPDPPTNRSTVNLKAFDDLCTTRSCEQCIFSREGSIVCYVVFFNIFKGGEYCLLCSILQYFQGRGVLFAM